MVRGAVGTLLVRGTVETPFGNSGRDTIGKRDSGDRDSIG